MALFRKQLGTFFKRARVVIAVWYAKCWLRVENGKFAIGSWFNRYAFRVLVFVLPIVIGGSIFFAGYLEPAAQDYFDKERIARLSSLIVTVGGALVGATAIAFSVVVFSVQINIERTPDGLFQTLSRDRRLILAFLATVVMSVVCASLSLFTDPGHIARIITAATWMAFCVPLFIVYAYLRALKLINPRHQLSMLFTRTARYLKQWSRRADRLKPWVAQSLQPPPPPDDPNNVFDYVRAYFLSGHSQWLTFPGRSISQAMTYARTYAKTGDSQVVGIALYTITNINAAYIAAKGRTFYSHNALVNDYRSSDGIVTHTLEAYRQSLRDAVHRGDETEITQLLAGLGTLAVAYSNIKYPRVIDPLYHAALAKGYLTQEVLEMLPHVSADVMMQGAKHIADLSGLFLRAPDFSAQESLASALIGIAQYGLNSPKNSPASLRAIEQITRMSVLLIRAPEGDPAQALASVTKQMFRFAKLVFRTPDNGLTSSHSNYLSPYFGGGILLDMETFDSQLTTIVNAVVQADENNEGARRIVNTLADWSEDLPQGVRDLLESATAARTRYSASIVWWLINVSTALYAASTAQAGDEGDRETLKNSASWILSAINFIPHDEYGVGAMRAVDIPEQLLRMARQLRAFVLNDEAVALGELIDNWLLKTIPHTDSHEVAEGLFGLAALYAHLQEPLEITALATRIRTQLPLMAGYTAEYKAATIAQMRERLNNLGTGHVDLMSYVENMASNAPLPVVRTNVEALIQALGDANSFQVV